MVFNTSRLSPHVPAGLLGYYIARHTPNPDEARAPGPSAPSTPSKAPRIPVSLLPSDPPAGSSCPQGCCEHSPVVSPPRVKRDPLDPRPRTDYLSWDDYMMAVAFLSAQRSKDPNRQVRCQSRRARRTGPGRSSEGAISRSTFHPSSPSSAASRSVRASFRPRM